MTERQREREGIDNELVVFLPALLFLPYFSYCASKRLPILLPLYFFLDFVQFAPLLAIILGTWAAILPLSRVLMGVFFFALSLSPHTVGRHYTLDVAGGLVLGLVQFYLITFYLWLPLPHCLALRETLLAHLPFS